MKFIRVFVGGVIAGALISLGGAALLASPNKIIGAFLFTLGLLSICMFSFNLYTGKIGTLFDHPFSYCWDLVVILLGNGVGTLIIGESLRLTSFTSFLPKASEMMINKMNCSWYSLIILGILCGIMVFIGVEGYKKASSNLGKILCIIMSIMLFILCGFEHSIADMFYLTFTHSYTWEGLRVIGLVVVGNTIGAWICYGMLKVYRGDKND